MYKDADIITTLTDAIGAESAQISVERILRVPQAWEALREPAFLKQALEASGGQALFPSMLAAIAMGTQSLTEALESDSIGPEDSKSGDLRSTARQALELCRIERASGPSALIDYLLDSSKDWHSALICAWPEFEDHAALLEIVAEDRHHSLMQLIAGALLAYMSAQQAAQELLATKADIAFRFLPWLNGEPALHDALQGELSDLADLFKAGQVPSADRTAEDALILSQVGRAEEANEVIRRAWDLSTRQTADVADRLAGIARDANDLVLEAEARQQALDAYPSSTRRSTAALSLLQIERYEDALNLVREGDSFEETIAAGLVYLAIQDTHTAGIKLNHAAQECEAVIPDSPEMFVQLAAGLEAVGYQVQAIKVYRHLVSHYPARADLRKALASLSYSIGDFETAIQQGYTAITLNPQDAATRELLAQSYEKIGSPKKAMIHWEQAAAEDIEKNIPFGECALSAGETDVAKQAADRVLALDPEHIAGLVLVGRSLSAAGDHSEAKTILKDVTERSPEDAEAWIALAASQSATDDIETAGHTLQVGLRANPDNPELHIALAHWLKSMDRNAEALDHVRSAMSSAPDKIEWQMLHADLLSELGHLDDARLELEKIIAVESANWTAIEKLARICEKLDDTERALALVKDAPEQLTPESAYYVGRLLASTANSPEELELSTRRLAQAKEGGFSEPPLDYWMGLSAHKQAHHQPAAKHFLRYLQAVKDSQEEHYLDATVGFAQAALEIGETTMALTQLEKAKPSNPTSIDLLSTLSEAHYKSGDRQKALEIARELTELHPDSDAALLVFKTAAERAGEIKDALEAQHRITAKSPDDPANWLALSSLNLRNGDEQASRDGLAKAIMLGRQNAEVLSDAADCAENMNRSTLEVSLRKRAVELNNTNDAMHTKLAKAASRVGDYASAADAWLELAARNPRNSEILVSTAKVLWKLDRRTAALGLFQQATTVEPDQAEAHFELGRALISMNEIERGLNEITTALSVDPQNSIMRAQAASIIAKYSDPKQALALLDDSPSAGKFPDVAEARAECYWLNGQVLETHSALSSIPAAVPLSAKGAALQTLVKLADSDFSAARSEYRQISLENIRSASDLQWALLAGLALEDFKIVSGLIERALQRDLMDPEALPVALQAILDMHNLDWIYSTLAGVSTYATGLSEKTATREETINELVNAIEQSALPEITVATAQSLKALIAGQSRAEAFESHENGASFDRMFLKRSKAIALLRANRPVKAIQQLETMPHEPFNRSFSAIVLGLAHSAADQYTAAEKSFKIAAEYGHWKPLTHYFEAQMWESSGAVEKAISALNDALSLQPDIPGWHEQLASMYQLVGQSDVALPHLQQAAELAPEDSEILVALARAYRSNGQLSDAEEIYARCLQANPSSPIVWKEAGQVALASGDSERAEAWFERACSLLPADASCMIDSARAAQQIGKPKLALERARKAYDLASDDPHVLSGLGDILAQNGSLDKAIQIYDRAMRLSEHSADVRLSRSKLLLQADRPQESISDLEQLVEADPDHHQAWEFLAKAYASRHEFDAGLHAAQQAVNIAPRSLEYRLLMAQLCRQSGQLDQALEILSELESEAPERVDVAREKGFVHEERRELELAIDAYNRALAIDSHDAETVVRAGLLLKQLKAYEESAALLERGTELLPNDADLHQQLAAVRALQFVHGQRIDEQVVA